MARPLFPSFFIGGFECSTLINRDRRRIDELEMTQHDRFVVEDYRMMMRAEIRCARDGVRWNRIDSAGRLDFSSAIPFIDAARAGGMHIVWDLFHYGYPDDLDPFKAPFVERFAAYCHAFARLLKRRTDSVPFFTPVNEISYFAWAGGEVGMFAPFGEGRGAELKRRLAIASIAGMNAILAVEPRARFVHCEPIVRVVAPRDAPHLHDEAEFFNYHCVHEAWDLIAGVKAPELGGSRRHLDILGVNYYGYNQWEHQRPDNVLAPDDPRRAPFGDLLLDLHDRYRVPMIVSETSSHGEFRASWLRDMGRECLRAIEAGVDLQGLCIYPIVDMFDWHNVSDLIPLRMGLWELCRSEDDPTALVRVPHEPTFREMTRLRPRFECAAVAAR